MRELSWKDAASSGYETRVLVILISFLKRTLHIQEALVVFIIHVVMSYQVTVNMHLSDC